MPVGDGVEGDALEDREAVLMNSMAASGERDEVFGQRENDAVRLGLDAGEGAGGLGEEGEGLAALAAGELAGEVEEAAASVAGGLDVGEKGGALLEVGAGVGPAGGGEGFGEGEEGDAVLAGERLEAAGGDR